MAQIRTSTQEMRGAAETVEQLASDYRKQVQALYQTGSELDNQWDCDANASFTAQMGQDQARFEQLNTVLAQYVQVMRDNAAEYDKTEGAAVQVIQTKSTRRT